MIMSGGGRAVVCAVGDNTSIGRKNEKNEMTIESGDTPLKLKLEECLEVLTKYCYFITAVIVVAQSINLMIVIMTAENKEFFGAETIQDGIKIFITGVCILIVAIPEGMPLAVSLSMALSIDIL